jgi:hypothetical protein
VTFLAKLGSFLAKGIAILTGLEPLIAPLFGSKAQAAATTQAKVINDLNAIAQVVVSAEAILGPGTGAQKLAKATPLVVNIVRTSELLSGHKIKNETLFLQGCVDLTSSIAEILNALDPASIGSSGQPLPATPPAQTQVVPAAVKETA